MTTVDRNQTKAPVLPEEVVPVEALGGNVIVRGLLMSQQMAIAAQTVLAATPQEGESVEAAQIRAKSLRVAETLARTVVLADGKPLWTAPQWDVFGCQHPSVALELFNKAQRLNGQDEDASVKN